MQPVASNAGVAATFTAAQTAVLLSYVSYDTDPVDNISHYLPGWEVVWNGQVTSDGNYAFIAKDTNSGIYGLGIRGSLPVTQVFQNWDTFANWVIEDLDVVTVVPWAYASTPKPVISNGSNTAFTNLMGMQDTLGSGQNIATYLSSNVISNNSPLMITGHSLGGNMANLFASYLVSTLPGTVYSVGNLSLYTFAAPAAGNSDFATDLDSKLPTAWHYHNANDIVPACPVYDLVALVSLLYDPSPAASQITVTFKGVTVSLREGFLMLAGGFYFYGYTQQSNNYRIFPNPLNPSYQQNTAEDFFQQAGSQHGLVNYAAYLNVTIPPTAAVL